MTQSTITPEKIKSLVNVLNYIQEQFALVGERTGDTETMIRSCWLMETYKNALYFTWEKLGYGWHSDFWKEGDSMVEYDLFLFQIKEILPDLIESLRIPSSFHAIDPEEKISLDLSSIYTDLLDKISKGEITV